MIRWASQLLMVACDSWRATVTVTLTCSSYRRTAGASCRCRRPSRTTSRRRVPLHRWSTTRAWVAAWSWSRQRWSISSAAEPGQDLRHTVGEGGLGMRPRRGPAQCPRQSSAGAERRVRPGRHRTPSRSPRSMDPRAGVRCCRCSVRQRRNAGARRWPGWHARRRRRARHCRSWSGPQSRARCWRSTNFALNRGADLPSVASGCSARQSPHSMASSLAADDCPGTGVQVRVKINLASKVGVLYAHGHHPGHRGSGGVPLRPGA